MPGNVGANTYNSAIAIGEKAAVMIAEDLGIKGVTSEWTWAMAADFLAQICPKDKTTGLLRI